MHLRLELKTLPFFTPSFIVKSFVFYYYLDHNKHLDDRIELLLICAIKIVIVRRDIFGMFFISKFSLACRSVQCICFHVSADFDFERVWRKRKDTVGTVFAALFDHCKIIGVYCVYQIAIFISHVLPLPHCAHTLHWEWWTFSRQNCSSGEEWNELWRGGKEIDAMNVRICEQTSTMLENIKLWKGGLTRFKNLKKKNIPKF